MIGNRDMAIVPATPADRAPFEIPRHVPESVAPGRALTAPRHSNAMEPTGATRTTAMEQIARPDPLARARELADDVARSADEIERSQTFPEPLLGRLHASRLLRMLLPKVYGGDQVTPGEYLLALEEIAKADASVAWNMFVANSAALIAAFLPPESAHAIYDDPKSVIAWGPPNACRLEATEGGYIVAGRWDFASGSRQANWMGAHGLVREMDGSIRLNDAGQPHVRSALFPANEANLRDLWDPIGLRGTCSDTYEVDGTFVAEAFSATREDPGLRLIPGPLYAIPQQALYAVGVAGVALGTARAMLTAFAELAQDKTPRGLSRLADDDGVLDGFARAEAKLAGSRAYVLETSADVMAAADEWAPIDMGERARLRLATTTAIHKSIEAADWVYKAAGVDAIFPTGPFHRRFRDIHTLSQQVQSRDSHYRTIARIMLDSDPPDAFY